MMLSSTFVVASLLLAHLRLHEAFHNPERSVRQTQLRKPLKTTTDDVEIKLDAVYDIESWRNGYKTCKKETVEALESGIPADLEGTYFRNGMGKFESARVPILHPFDADGMMVAVTMKVTHFDKETFYSFVFDAAEFPYGYVLLWIDLSRMIKRDSYSTAVFMRIEYAGRHDHTTNN
jgi:hypothetical protein